MAPVLGYWKLRGLGQAIKLLLEYTGEAYEEKQYHFGPAPENDASEWLSVKYNLGIQLPNLPYYVDGNIKIVQSHAILRYIARKHDLCGKDEAHKVKVDIFEHQAMDVRVAYGALVYVNYETKREEYFKNFQTTLKNLSEALGDQKWFTGDSITFPDFLFYELFDIHGVLQKGCLDNFPNLKAYQKRFEELPAIKKYMASDKFVKYPLNGPMAFIGGRPT